MLIQLIRLTINKILFIVENVRTKCKLSFYLTVKDTTYVEKSSIN